MFLDSSIRRFIVVACLASHALLALPTFRLRASSSSTFDGQCIALNDATLQQEKTEIDDAKLVPDLYKNDFTPSTTVALYYDGAFVDYGEKLTVLSTLLQPSVYFPKPKNDVEGTTYTLIINDPDEPKSSANSSALHWLRRGLVPNCESPASDSGQDVRLYIPPIEAPTGAPVEHRYTISILREPAQGYDPSALEYLFQLTTFDFNEYENSTGATLIGSTYFHGSLL